MVVTGASTSYTHKEGNKHPIKVSDLIRRRCLLSAIKVLCMLNLCSRRENEHLNGKYDDANFVSVNSR